MSALPMMPFWVPDYLADTLHLSRDEHGAYLLLILHYWQHGSLPDDDEKLARIARCTPEEWSNGLRTTVQGLFKDGWKHPRIESERIGAFRRIEAAKDAGLASGRARRMKSADKTNDRSPTVRTSVERPLNSLQPQPHPHSLRNFKKIGIREERGPRHGAMGNGVVYIHVNTPEWKQYAEQYEAAHGFPPQPIKKYGGTGCWFKTAGEAAE